MIDNFLLIAAMQLIPTTLLHINHPLPEIIGAIPFGLATAWLALRFNSIWPGLIIHALVGIVVDSAIIFSRTL
jgi:membrane protease YdiL (CAAX protease family)